MKKYFIFAAVAAAGLLTSCSSSDDVAANEGQLPQYAEGEQVPIILGATARADVDVTKGTGTVGDLATNTASNVWGGQHVWVYMMEKGSLNLAKENANDTKGIYENTEMRTPNPSVDITGAARELVAVDNNGMYQQYRYYPMTGNFDFWAYHIDDAGTNAGKPAPVVGADDVTVPFRIDGTQDLMVAHAWPTTAETSALGVGAQNDFYSAKAARANLQPNLTFQHLLTRLQFVVKGGNQKTCGWVDTNSDGDLDAVPTAGYYTGIFVKSIEVISKNTGKIVAAYTRADKDVEPGKTPTELISFNATADYPTLPLAAALPADYAWFPVMGTHQTASAATTGSAATYAWVASDEATYTSATTTKTDVVTTADDVAAAIAAYGVDAAAGNVGEFVRFYKNNDGVDGYQVGTGTANDDVIVGYAVSTETAAAVPGTSAQKGDVTALPALYDATIYNDDVVEVSAATTVYNWVASDEATYTSATTTKTDVVTTADNVAAAITTYATGTPAAAGNVGEFVRFYKNNDGVDGYQVGTGAANDDVIIGYAVSTGTAVPAVNSTKWQEALKINAAPVAPATANAFAGIIRPTWTGAAADEVSVGSAMMVSTENQYIMKIKLGQLVLDKGTIPVDDQNLEGTEQAGPSPDKYALKEYELTKPFALSATPANDPFKIGTSYKVLLTVYGAERIDIKATLTGWAAGADVDVDLQ